MTKQEMVAQWIKDNPEPDQSLLPRIFLQWTGSAKKYGGDYLNIYDTQTGKKRIIMGQEYQDAHIYPHWANNNLDLYRNPASEGCVIVCSYIKNIPEYEMVEFSVATMPIGRPDKMKNVDKRKWEYPSTKQWYTFGNVTHNRLFIFKGDSTAYDETSNIAWPTQAGKYYNHQVMRFITHVMGHMSTYNCTQNAQQLSEFICGNKDHTKCPINIRDSSHWSKWYQNMQQRNKSEKAKKVSNMLASAAFRDELELAKLAPIVVTKHIEMSPSGYEYDKSIVKSRYAFIDKVGDSWVISCYTRNASFGYYNRRDMINSMTEGETRTASIPFDAHPIRIIIDKKGKPSIQTYNSSTNEYKTDGRKVKAIFDYQGDDFELYENDNWDDCPFLDYARSTTAVQLKQRTMEMIISSLRYPIIQKMGDAGYNNLIYRMRNESCGVSGFLKSEIGMLTSSSKATLSEAFGMTDEQLKYLNSQYAVAKNKYGNTIMVHNGISKVMEYIKRMEPVDNDIRSMSLEDFKYLVDEIKEVANTYAWFRDLLIANTSYWHIDYNPEIAKVLKKTLFLKRDNPELYGIIKDYIGIINSFNYNNRPPVADIFHYIGETVESARAFYNTLMNLKAQDALGNTIDWSAI